MNTPPDRPMENLIGSLKMGVQCILCVGAVIFATPPPLSAASAQRVLILFSNDRLLPANQRYDEGLRRATDPKGDEPPVAFYAEFLDAIRLGGPEREAAMEEYLAVRYRDTPPEVLVALGPQALSFLLDRKATLFPNTPLIFGGVSSAQLDQLHGQPALAGLPMELDVAPIVGALLEMRPQTKELVLVHGAAAFDRSWRDQAVRQCAQFQERVKLTLLPELSLNDLKARLGTLPSHAAVVYLTYFQSPEGETYTPARIAVDIAASSSVPVVGPYDTYLGTGILGVSVSPFEDEGMALGGILRRVLDGETPGSVGIAKPNPPHLILDARAIRRWNLTKVPAGAELRFLTPSLWRQHRSAVIAAATVLALQGFLIGGLVIARVRQMRAERELRFSEVRFSGVFRGSPAAMSIVRQSDGRIVEVNPEWETITCVSRAQALGKTPAEAGMMLTGDDEDPYRRFLESSKPLEDYEQIHTTPEGHTRVLSISTELITLHDEPCYVIVAKDVTQPRAEEDARQQLARVSRLAMLGEMTASISHEVNQPLGAILSNADAAEMLLDLPSPPLSQIRQILKDIRRDDLRASAVIQRVRGLVGRQDVQRVPICINDVLVDTLGLVTHDSKRRGVTLVQDLAPNLPETQADPIMLQQVILNLLLNAMDAMSDTPVGSRCIILRSALSNEGKLELSVEDCGHGIPAEKLGRVFDSFFTTKEHGMGLGLALARSIAEAHSGRLVAKNNPSGGTTFYLVLPINPSA